jgi:hypothetical protein
MTAKDSAGNYWEVTGIAFQTGSTVTMAHMIGSTSNPYYGCYPYEVTLSNGNVNGATFTGTFTVTSRVTPPGTDQANTITFTAALAPDGLSITSGTYTSATTDSCFPNAVTGTFDGHQVPSVSGNWTGTIQPCTWNSQTGTCALFGTSSTMSAILNQDDATASVSGSYSVTNLAGVSHGTAIVPNPNSFLSGPNMEMFWLDANGNSFTVAGGPDVGSPGLAQDGSFVGVVAGVTNSNYYWLTMSH